MRTIPHFFAVYFDSYQTTRDKIERYDEIRRSVYAKKILNRENKNLATKTNDKLAVAHSFGAALAAREYLRSEDLAAYLG